MFREVNLDGSGPNTRIASMTDKQVKQLFISLSYIFFFYRFSQYDRSYFRTYGHQLFSHVIIVLKLILIITNDYY